MKKKAVSIFAVLMLLMVFTGCRGRSSGDSGQVLASGGGDQPSFNVNGAKQLVSLSNTIAPASSSAQSKGFFAAMFGGNTPFQYTVVNQGLTDQEILARAKGVSSPYRAAATPAQAGTNLLAIDADGNASLAVNSNYMIKVMYSVTDPAGEYVYLALDTGFINPDGNDYTQFIAQNNCAFYRVKIADNSYACVQEGVYVQPMDDSYMSRVSGNQKPVQFDADGNMYFAGTTFVRTCDDQGNCTLNAAAWSPRIYRVAKTDWSVIPLTQDNQKVSYFLVLSTGEIAYISSTTGGTALYLWQKSTSDMNPNGTTIDLTGPSGISFFTVDTFNTIIWGTSSTAGIRFGRPAASGVDKATFSTKIFSSRGVAVTPARIIVGDDGKLYGVFSDYRQDYDPVTKTYSTTSLMKVYEVLPSNPVPKLEIPLSKTINQNIMASSTPFQVSHGFLFYKETTEKLGYGTVDVIRMVNLSDRTTTTLLGGQNDWYEIYNWRLKGDRLYFAALDLSKTIVVSGEIDIAAVQQNPLRPPSDYLSVRQSASALGATSRVQDIEALVALPSLASTGTPTVQKIYASTDNLYSASVEFSDYMDKKSVESHIQFTDTDHGTPVASMKVWIHKFLHMIPDLDDNGTNLANDPLLDLASSKPLDFNTNYKIDVLAGSQDIDNPPNSITSTASLAFKTRPEFGWYVSAEVGKYVGVTTKDDKGNLLTNPPSFEYYDLNVDDGTAHKVPLNFRLQFRAKNLSYDGIGITLYDTASPLVFGYDYNNAGVVTHITYTSTYAADRKIVDIKMSSSYINMSTETLYLQSVQYGYLYVNSQYAYTGTSIPSLFNGTMMYYRIDVYGNTLAISYSQDGVIFTPVSLMVWDSNQGVYTSVSNVSNLVDRDASHEYRLLMRVSQPIDFDDILLTPLDNLGALSGSAIMNVDFNAVVPPMVKTDLAPAANVPDLRTSATSSYSALN